MNWMPSTAVLLPNKKRRSSSAGAPVDVETSPCSLVAAFASVCPIVAEGEQNLFDQTS
ncbi:hypothetical protein AGR7B_pAt0274 [Agrobacterium deltaense RV3]|nr:hypothetical protein AGR7B_pAt0274 [Agrobacterium deltaense RV3]